MAENNTVLETIVPPTVEDVTIPVDESALELRDKHRSSAKILGVKFHLHGKTGESITAEVYSEVWSWIEEKQIDCPALDGYKAVPWASCLCARFEHFCGCSHSRYVYNGDLEDSSSEKASEFGRARDYMRGVDELFRKIRKYPELFLSCPTWDEFRSRLNDVKGASNSATTNKLATAILAILGASIGKFDGTDQISKDATAILADIRSACTKN